MNRLSSLQRRCGPRRQAGLTMIELLVAVTLGMVVAIAAVATLIIGRQGFTVVDSTAQLRENARFATSMIQRVGIQAGFENSAGGNLSDWKLFCRDGAGAATTCGDTAGDTNPGVRGYDNALLHDGSVYLPALTTPGAAVHDTRTANCGSVSDTSCLNGSDVLLVRYWGDGRTLTTGDGSMINCAGANEPEGTRPAYSIFHVMRSGSGEPTLVCTTRDPTTFAWLPPVPLVAGVEGFQVLYGVDNVAPATAPPAEDAGTDSVPDRYLRASQLDVAGNAAATADNWRRVRSIRVGLLIRGAPNSAVDKAASGRTYNVLGSGFTVSGDIGSGLTVAADGRLRQSVVFTVHLRNPQFSIPTRWNP